MKRFFAALLSLLAILLPVNSVVFAAMVSPSYQIPWDAMSDGGGEAATSTSFIANETIGLQGIGFGTSTNFQISAGYRVAETSPTLSLAVRSQETSTQTAYTAFSNGGNSVTVSSVGAFSMGDTIGVVEDQGFAQLVAVGRIVSIAGLVVTVDAWAGDQASMSAIPAGGNDDVFRLSSSSIAFGTVAAGSENAAVTVSSAIADTPNGFTVYTQANQLFQNGSAQPMATVNDGTVSTGSEEYGAEVTGATAYGVGDLGVTTTARIIQTKNTPTLSVPDRVAMIYKLSTIASTNPGSYSQVVFYTLTANF